jgi:hypothetical protein
VLFRLSNDARQDVIKKNRWWFKYPEEWANRTLKDKVLGIRSLYLLPDWFYITFDFYINFYAKMSPAYPLLIQYEVHIKDLFVGRNNTLNDVCQYFNKIVKDFIEKYEIDIDYLFGPFDVHPEESFCRYEYLSDDPNDKNSRVRCIIKWNQVLGNEK